MKTLPRVIILRAAAAGGAAVAFALAVAPGARAAATGPAGHPMRGLDISAYQHTGKPINWRMLSRQGIRFVAIKVSEGTYYTNPYYRSDARAATAAGLALLPYVFANPGRARGAQTARFAVSAARWTRVRGRLPLVVDLENDPYRQHADCYGQSVREMNSWINGFVRTAYELAGEWPIIYTTASWWQECTGSTKRFAADPLWVAAFDGVRPTTPSPWNAWAFWQYDNDAVLPGIGQADLDYYEPTRALPALRPGVHRKHKAKIRHKAKHADKAKAVHEAKTAHKAEVAVKAKHKANRQHERLAKHAKTRKGGSA